MVYIQCCTHPIPTTLHSYYYHTTTYSILTSVFSWRIYQWLKYKVIDLRDNDPLLCVDLARQRAPHGFTILSNCRNTTSRTPSSESNRNRTTTQPSDHRVTTTEKSSIKSTVINDPTNKHTALIVHKGKSSTTLVYIYCLISAILIIPTGIITIRWIMRCWKSRRQTRNSPPISLQLFPLNVDSDSDNDEENLIFVRASTSV